MLIAAKFKQNDVDRRTAQRMLPTALLSMKNVVDYNTAQREHCLLHYNLYGTLTALQSESVVDYSTVHKECCLLQHNSQ